MDNYWLIPVIVAVASVLTLAIHAISRHRPDAPAGFGVAIVVILCWITAIAIILHRVHA